MSGFVYLAYPIDQAVGQRVDRIQEVKDGLAGWGYGTYDPGAAFTVGDDQPIGREIAAINNMALGRCQGMVALLPPGVVSVGVPMEIERARHNGKPLLIVGGDRSWALGGGLGNTTRRTDWIDADSHDLTWLVGQMRKAQSGAPVVLPFAQVRTGERQTELPQAAHPDDAGFDLVVSADWIIQPGTNTDIPCNLAVELPDWTWGLIIGRSSTMRKRKLQVQTGVIDSGYRGELFANVTSMAEGPVEVKRGERLAQLIVMSNQTRMFRPVWAQRLSESDRGAAGFGSTGL